MKGYLNGCRGITLMVWAKAVLLDVNTHVEAGDTRTSVSSAPRESRRDG